MRRVAVLAPIAAAAGVALVRRRRRARTAPQPPTGPPATRPTTAAAPPEPEARFVSVPWALVAAPADRPQLTVRFARDEHMRLDRVDAQETPTQVFVTVLVRWQSPAGGWFAWAEEQEATVSLSAPLGTRELVHAAVDLGAPPPPGDDPDGPPL